MLFDTHAHLNDKAFKRNRYELIEEIHKNGVTNITNVGTDFKSSLESIKLAEKYDFIYASIGIHPLCVNEEKFNFDKYNELAKHEKVVAIGEIGLDYHYKDFDKKMQERVLREQLRFAKELKKPVIIHDRDSGLDCVNIIIDENITNGVFHCYSGNKETAKKLVDTGLYISFTGVITFSNNKKIEETVRSIPNDRILIETDCPYLAPEPFRGQTNHSGNVRIVAEKVGQIKNMDFDEIANLTYENAKRLFLV